MEFIAPLSCLFYGECLVENEKALKIKLQTICQAIALDKSQDYL